MCFRPMSAPVQSDNGSDGSVHRSKSFGGAGCLPGMKHKGRFGNLISGGQWYGPLQI